ncbi:MAG: hypothetical protein LBT79_00750 [Elusimicrobiota bacterium]|jgi:hypothetical protein|nr:hypothetical protein [Elusimicrobiota bacterium]
MKAIDVFKIEGLNPEINFIAKDDNGAIFGFQDKPSCEVAGGEWMKSSYKDYHRLDKILQIEFDNDNWTKCIVERPIDYASMVGKWGVFSAFEKLDFLNGFVSKLEKYNCSNRCRFVSRSIDYEYFRPLTQEEKEEICK